MKKQIQKAKQHFQDNRQFYIGVGCGVAAVGFTCLIVREPRAGLGFAGPDSPIKESTGSFFSARTVFGDSTNTVTTVHNGHRGNPGFVTRNLETGALFETQGAAARAFDIPEDVLSKHLNGFFDNAKGMRFERIGVFGE